MQKYIPLRVHTALYLSVFLLALHHVFVYFANSSILKFFFNLKISEVLVVYGMASVVSVLIFIILSKKNIVSTKKQLYTATLVEVICLCLMYVATSMYTSSPLVALCLYVAMFCIHHVLTPYMLYNLDTLFEAYTHTEDRGRGRGIYLTMWNTPFVVVPFLLSALSMQSLPLVYLVSISILLPFMVIVLGYLQNPSQESGQGLAQKTTLPVAYISPKSFISKLETFFSDPLDRRSFITQTTLHLYYGITGVMLPIYLYTRFGFEWGKIGVLLAVTMTPFILTQIPFGKMEDKKHNEKLVFFLGVLVASVCTILALLVSPSIIIEKSFLLLILFLFFARVGCSLIEISTESMFYKHVNERDSFALLMFRAGRLLPYSVGLIALFWI